MCRGNVCLCNCGHTDSCITQETILNEIEICRKLLPSINLHRCHVQISCSFLSIYIQDGNIWLSKELTFHDEMVGLTSCLGEGMEDLCKIFRWRKALDIV